MVSSCPMCLSEKGQFQKGKIFQITCKCSVDFLFVLMPKWAFEFSSMQRMTHKYSCRIVMNIWSFFKTRDDYWLCVKRWKSFLVFPLVSPFLMWFIILLFGLCPCQLYSSLTPTHCSPSVRSHSPEWGACSSLCHLLLKELTLKKLQQHLHYLKWRTDHFHLATDTSHP